jgi:hypothetical protein
MKKIEALNFIRLHKGYVPYIGIFEIYNDEDEIPQELIDLSIKEDKPKENFIICSAELAEQLKNLK